MTFVHHIQQPLEINGFDFFLPAACFPLPNAIGGTWTPASCSAGPNDKGSLCKLQCDKGYELRGSSIIHCKNRRWNSVNGDYIPKCIREYGPAESALSFLLSRDENYRLLFKFLAAFSKVEGIRKREDI